jgi:predicted aldo/keto reductase-like oxidoreductase
MLGLGGFHLLEIPTSSAVEIIERYIDSGGNYVETAASYGNGESEAKVGRAVSKKRNQVILATKTLRRDAEGVTQSINSSLQNLGVDDVDILFMHAVATSDDLDKIMAPGGAMEGVAQAISQGKLRYVGISMHGHPGVLVQALLCYPFDVVMASLNYFDRCNYPELEKHLLPLAVEKDVGVLAMKPVADGLLWQSAENAFRYVWSLPGVACAVTGINSLEMLEQDVRYAREFSPMSEQAIQQLLAQAPELGDYVCRQCDNCCVECNLPMQHLFRLEGCYDRQMRDGRPRTPPEFALRDRLRFWYGNHEMARREYASQALDTRVSCTECNRCVGTCRYGIDVKQKIRYAHYKLSGNPSHF